MNALQLVGRKKKPKPAAQEAKTLINIPLKHGTDATPLTTNVFIYQSISHKSLFHRLLSPLAGNELLEKVGESENSVHLLGLIISPSHLLLYPPHTPPPPTDHQNCLCALQLPVCQLLSGELTRPESWMLRSEAPLAPSSKRAGLPRHSAPLSSFIPPFLSSPALSPRVPPSLCHPLVRPVATKFPPWPLKNLFPGNSSDIINRHKRAKGPQNIPGSLWNLSMQVKLGNFEKIHSWKPSMGICGNSFKPGVIFTNLSYTAMNLNIWFCHHKQKHV